ACRVGTLADAGSARSAMRREESRRGTQECVRHQRTEATGWIKYISALFKGVAECVSYRSAHREKRASGGFANHTSFDRLVTLQHRRSINILRGIFRKSKKSDIFRQVVLLGGLYEVSFGKT
ncbi:MAG TPA: hypothetical protein VMB85_16955, partial [Bryobacteraceae bacterium]|nr:hypothetical protein [Bryobacteraceae bacterium]